MSNDHNGNQGHSSKYMVMVVNNEFLCPFSHGWKEQEYHPRNFKMNACRNDSQCSKPHCPYFHSDTQKRAVIQEGFKLQPRNRGSAFGTNDYIANFIQNQAPILLPHRSKIYHPSTAPFVNSDTFMRQPYYIIHASLGFKDQTQYSYYLSGHAEEQFEFKQRQHIDQKQGKMPRTFSHNSQMNATVSTPFYPGKNKMMPKPPMTMPQYKDMNKRIPTSASHGMLAGMNRQVTPVAYAAPPGLDRPYMSQTNLYAAHAEGMSDNWNHHPPYQQQQEMGYHNSPSYNQWEPNTAQMIPLALQSQRNSNVKMKPKNMTSMKGSMSTQFNYNFGSKLINENEDRFGLGYLDNDSDSDGGGDNKSYPHFQTNFDPIKKFKPSELKNVKEQEENKQ